LAEGRIGAAMSRAGAKNTKIRNQLPAPGESIGR
jgi:hypothetical protein